MPHNKKSAVNHDMSDMVTSPLVRSSDVSFNPINRFFVSTAIAVFFLFYSVMIVLPGFSLLKDPDTLWHIRTGQWILDNAQFPVVDFYSYTAAGKRWIAGEWLSEILFALAFNIGRVARRCDFERDNDCCYCCNIKFLFAAESSFFCRDRMDCINSVCNQPPLSCETTSFFIFAVVSLANHID